MRRNRRWLMERGATSAAFLAMASACGRDGALGGSDLAALDAVETAARIKAGDLTAREAVEAAIARAERIDPKLNAIVTPTYSRARQAADEIGDGPFAGVPTFVKDLDDVNGVATGYGSRAFPFAKGKNQGDLVSAYLDLGVISLGKSTTPEFGLSATTESIATGATRNPWNLAHSSGGSSGGAAALVASGVVPIAHASDGGGSIRIPASCCGNVGLKVSRGRNPKARPDNPALPITISVHGVQSRTVRDTAAVLAGIERPAEISGLKAIGLVAAPNKRRLRIGLAMQGVSGRPVDREVIEATERVAARCEELGHEVAPFTPPFTAQLEEDFVLYWAALANSIVSVWDGIFPFPPNRFAFEPFTLGLVELYKANEEKFAPTVARLEAATPMFDAEFENFDVILSPVLAAPPAPIGFLGARLDYETLLDRLLGYVQFTAFYNVTGAPAISLPLSMSKGGLPIGAMFGARMGDERTLLELAFEFEEAMPWRDRRPPIFG